MRCGLNCIKVFLHLSGFGPINMFWLNMILNAGIFIVVFNLPQLLKPKEQRKPWNLTFSLVLPISLALLLTVIDSFRLFFAYQLLLFMGGAAVIYWLLIKWNSANRN